MSSLIHLRNLPTAIHSCDLVVVGSGFFGATISNVLATKYGKRILVIESRDHLGGNAHSYRDTETDIDVHKYGSHLFHTSNSAVWEFVTRFSSFTSYEHRVYARFNNEVFNLPINLHTLSQFFGKVFTPEIASSFIKNPMNKSEESFEQRAIASIGVELYEAFFKNYTAKQWGIPPEKLPGSTFSRLPIRLNFDSRYFQDKYQGLPVDGFDALFKKMLNHENVLFSLNTDFFMWKNFIRSSCKPVVYTGPLDRYFDYCYGVLGWRTLDFQLEKLDVMDFQGTAVMNYPESTWDFTRIHEFKHLYPDREYTVPKTLIMKERSRQAKQDDEPYYPINSTHDREMLLKYRNRSKAEKGVIFGGRLGSYQYLDMHMAIASALSHVDEALKLIQQQGKFA